MEIVSRLKSASSADSPMALSHPHPGTMQKTAVSTVNVSTEKSSPRICEKNVGAPVGSIKWKVMTSVVLVKKTLMTAVPNALSQNTSHSSKARVVNVGVRLLCHTTSVMVHVLDPSVVPLR